MKKILAFLLIVGLFISGLSSPVFATSHYSVNEETAARVAQNHVNYAVSDLFSGYKDISLAKPVKLYDFQHKLIGYGVTVKSGDIGVGYVIVNNDPLDAPIPEFSVGKVLPFESLYEKALSKARLELTEGQALGTPRFIYPSALEYYVDFPVFIKDKIVSTIIIDMNRLTVVNPSDIREIPREYGDTNRNAKSWHRLKDGTEISSSIAPLNITVEKKIAGVPDYPWERGCVPTAEANVLAYWQSHGYPNFPTGSTLINELADLMNTTSDGTTYEPYFTFGFEQCSRNHGYGFASTMDSQGRSYSTYSKFTSDIDNNRPLMASLYGSTTYGNHSTTGMGYRYDDYQQWIIVHDTWPPTDDVYLDYNGSEVNSPRWTHAYP